MKMKRAVLVIFARLVRGAGMGLGASGIAFSIWFFLFSNSESKYLWGAFSIVEYLVGYYIYRFAYTYIYDE